MLRRGEWGILKKTTYAGDVKERQESNSDDVEPDAIYKQISTEKPDWYHEHEQAFGQRDTWV